MTRNNIAYLLEEDGIAWWLCPNCAASEEDESGGILFGLRQFANWGNPSLYCDGCGRRVESAYAEDE